MLEEEKDIDIQVEEDKADCQIDEEMKAAPPLKVEKPGCKCNKLLIVDDNEYNLFVLQNYLKLLHMRADEVRKRILSIGSKWARSHCQNDRKNEKPVLSCLPISRYGYKHAVNEWDRGHKNY